MSLRDLMRKVAILDGVDIEKKPPPSLENAQIYAAQDMKLKVASAFQTLCETDDLDESEDMAMRLQNLFIGIVDVNKDDELDDMESAYLETLCNYAWDYLSEKGISDDDCSALLNDWDSDAADRIVDMLNGTYPDGDESGINDMNNFAFSDDENRAVLDGVFKKVISFVNGVKTRIKRRVSGHAHLSSKQKVAIKKMYMKSHSAAAQMHRMKSMMKRKKSGF